MKSRLPATPLDALSISGALRAIVKTIHTCADVFGFWKYPSKKTAGDFEEMTLLDKIYWGYKSKKPIIHPERISQKESFFNKSMDKAPIFTLPQGFEKKHSITFSAVGDLIKVEGLENSKDQLYEKVADLIFDKDISYANLESQLTGQDLGAYIFSDKETPPVCCTKEQYDALKSHKGKNYTVIHTACNHTLDMELEGLETTLEQLEKDNIIDLGTNRKPEEQQKGRIIEKNGIKIGFVSATFGLNGKEVPRDKEYMVNVVKFHHKHPPDKKVDLTLLKNQISFCQKQKCDIIIASLHWGYEYEFFPRLEQVDTAHDIIEAGADIIVSHHAHVIQPIEYYQTQRDPERIAIITYSLGNLTTSFSAPHLVLSAVLNLTMVKGTVNDKEKTYIEEAKLMPVVQTESNDGDLPIIQLEKLDTFSARKCETKEEKDYITAVKRYASLILGKNV